MGDLLLLGKLCDNGELPYPLWALVRKQTEAKLGGKTWISLKAEEGLIPMTQVWDTLRNTFKNSLPALWGEILRLDLKD